MQDWLPTLGLSSYQWEGMLLPWAASLFSGIVEQARSLSARAAMIFAAEALRVCRVALLINDLRRSALSLALTRCAGPLFRSRLTRHDSVASVRRAYDTRRVLI